MRSRSSEGGKYASQSTSVPCCCVLHPNESSLYCRQARRGRIIGIAVESFESKHVPLVGLLYPYGSKDRLEPPRARTQPFDD